MARIWSDEGKLARWLDVELAALAGLAEVGAVPAEAVAEIAAKAEPPTTERVAEIEALTHHDVAATEVVHARRASLAREPHEAVSALRRV